MAVGDKSDEKAIKAHLDVARADALTLLQNIIANVAILQHHEHSRSRVYPQDVGATATLIAGTPANTFGSWIEIIPIDTIDFCYEAVGLVIEAANAATTYLIQLGFSIADGSEPATAQITGERRVLLPTPIPKTTELLDYYSDECPANAKLWGRIKTASGNADQLEVSVVAIRHIEITNPIAHLTTWPWST
ncbi:hypothetical protein ES703_36096 [subsurface metagenome]